MRFNRKATLAVIKTIGRYAKATEKFGEVVAGIGKTTSKLFNNEDFQVELTNSCELVFNTARDRVFGLVDHYRHVIEDDFEETLCKFEEFEKANKAIHKEKKEDLQ